MVTPHVSLRRCGGREMKLQEHVLDGLVLGVLLFSGIYVRVVLQCIVCTVPTVIVITGG